MEISGWYRSVQQIKQKWQVLKRQYSEIKKHNNCSGNSCMEYHPLMCEILDSRPSSILENNGCDTLDIEHLNGEWNEEYLNDNVEEHNSDFDLPSTSAFLNPQNNADETNWELGIDDLPST
ncbi:uncharacterized protein LOC119667772 [Teleopsis dalmanni]|uniref:uncharacterized protein LOC119667772 n=1 Tax=Teleopsis dalmanni TaxID=139649 RepID=UPI0018CCDB09|nr:uncharacterized protein LOC119667772 [Teleopsis dalmanni]